MLPCYYHPAILWISHRLSQRYWCSEKPCALCWGNSSQSVPRNSKKACSSLESNGEIQVFIDETRHGCCWLNHRRFHRFPWWHLHAQTAKKTKKRNVSAPKTSTSLVVKSSILKLILKLMPRHLCSQRSYKSAKQTHSLPGGREKPCKIFKKCALTGEWVCNGNMKWEWGKLLIWENHGKSSINGDIS